MSGPLRRGFFLTHTVHVPLYCVCATIRSGLNLANMLIPRTISIGPTPASQSAFPGVKQDWGRGDEVRGHEGTSTFE